MAPRDRQHWGKGQVLDTMMMAVATRKDLADESSSVPPPDKEFRGLGHYRKGIYASATFALWAVNYLAHITRSQRDLSKEFSASISSKLSVVERVSFDRQLGTLLSSTNTSMWLTALATPLAVLDNSIAIQWHTWMCLCDFVEDFRSTFINTPYDGSTLFRPKVKDTLSHSE